MDGYKASSFLERPGAKDVAIELFSCSKAYNMTGWRVAFAAGNATAIKALGTVKSNIDSGVFTAVQDAAIEAMLGPQEPIADAERALPAPSRPRAGCPRQHRHRGPRDKPRRHDLRMGEGARGLHLGELRRQGPRGGQRHRRAPAPRTGRAARATSASRSRRLTTVSKRPSSASRTPCERAHTLA